MKALSVRMPDAHLIVEGFKPIETRTWQTNYRGWIIICAAGAVARPQRMRFIAAHERQHQRPWRREEMGHAIGLVELYACVPMESCHESAALVDARPGLWAWIFSNPVRLREPFPVKGRLGLFDVQLPEGATP